MCITSTCTRAPVAFHSRSLKFCNTWLQATRATAGTKQAHPLVRVRVFLPCITQALPRKQNHCSSAHVARPPLVDRKHRSLSTYIQKRLQLPIRSTCWPTRGGEDALLLCFYRIECVGNYQSLLLLIILSFRAHNAAVRRRPPPQQQVDFVLWQQWKNPSGLSHKVTFSWQQSFIHTHTTTFQAITLLLHKLAQVGWFV